MESTTHTRRGRKAGQGSRWIRPTTRRRLYARDNHRCVYCGCRVGDGHAMATLDHVTPCELGGTNAHSNLVTCCLSCNSAKGAKPVRGFLAWLRGTRDIDTTGIARRVRNATARVLPKL